MNLQHPNSFRIAATGPIKSSTQSASENIRERLNLHLKRRIQVQEKSTHPQLLSSSSSSCSSLSPPQHRLTIKSDHLLPQNLCVESNPSFTTTPILSNNPSTVLRTNQSIIAGRSKGLKKLKTTKKLPSTKKLSTSPSHMVRTQNGNQISVYSTEMRKNCIGSIGSIGDKFTDRKSTTTLIEINTLPSGATTTTTTTTMNEQSSSPPPPTTPTPEMKSGTSNYEKSDNKTAYSSDILSMILNEKKNRLMHDPEIMRFLANIHMNLFINRANR